MHNLSLFAVLAVLWLLWSGHYTALLLVAGAVSCLLVVYIAQRMRVIDHESHPLHIWWRLPVYWVWLGIEIVKSNIDVAKRVLHPSLPIDPQLFEVEASQKSDLGLVIYANSITLTPGTVSTDVNSGRIQVHALSRDGMEAVKAGDMDRKVTALER